MRCGQNFPAPLANSPAIFATVATRFAATGTLYRSPPRWRESSMTTRCHVGIAQAVFENRSGTFASSLWLLISAKDGRRPIMSDYDYRNPEDPFQRDTAYDPNVRTGNSAWGWIAAAVFVAIVLAVVFGMGHQPGQNGTNTASNEMRSPAATQMAPPAKPSPTTSAAPSTTPAPANPAPPVTPAPNSNPQQ